MTNKKIRTGSLRRIFDFAADCFFPPRCPVCDGLIGPEEKKIHKKCLKLLFPVCEPVCMKCGRRILSEEGEYCRECSRKFHSFVQAKGLFAYKGAIRKSMYRFKYQNRREYAEFFAEYAGMKYGKWMEEMHIDCIVPVPMYRKKRQIRGYNQAECFAVSLARRTELPVEKKLIYRERNTEALKLMNENQRQQTLKGAFSVKKDRLEEKGYRSILVVDDIYTTGSTVDAITAELLDHTCGIRIFVLTICSPAGYGII